MSMNPLHNYDQWKAGDYSATVDEWEDWAERIVAAFRAELNAAKKDFDQIGQLLLEQDTLKAERDEAVKAYADECATNVYLRDDYAALKRALEGERKVARHHASVINTARRLCNEGDEQIAALKRELYNERGLRYLTQNETSKRIYELEQENEALSELLSPLVDVELERDKLEETIDALIAVYDLTQRDVENALKKWGGKEQDDETRRTMDTS